VIAAGLPPEEPIMQWLRAEPQASRYRATCVCVIGRCEYHVRPNTGWIEARDYTDPRSMRSQFCQPDRPGQPYMHPSIEDARRGHT
jgi:hypothetical protein